MGFCDREMSLGGEMRRSLNRGFGRTGFYGFVGRVDEVHSREIE
jgi:hypothetical protein